MSAARATVLYDADCAFCKWSLDKILAWDRGSCLRPLSIQSPEGQELLSSVDPKARLDSWHLVTADGDLFSAGAAAAPLARLLRGGRPLAAILGASPRLTERAYRYVARHRDLWARLLSTQLDSPSLPEEPDTRFPGESSKYRRERNLLLEAEIELRRAIERVAAQRRALPPGGAVPDDYRFEEIADGGGEVRLSELFESGKDTLVVYSFMFPRWRGDTRPGPARGETAALPLAETPCPSCTSILDSLDGAAPHLAQRVNLAVVAKSDPDRIRNFARERGWRRLRLLSSRNNTYNHDYLAETPEGDQVPILNVFVRDGDQIRHSWATELMFAPRDEGFEPRHVDSIWPIWNVLDMTPDGRGTKSDFPRIDYE
jgi:predicted dithiol-disulfide oxidoreductase (DUF899 family)/predicted DCC family thiol-disulfide oxidoreductase YuxK